MLSRIRRQLLRSSRIRKAVIDFQQRQKEQRQHKHWAKLLKSGGMVR